MKLLKKYSSVLLIVVYLLVACKEKRKHYVDKTSNGKSNTTLKWIDYRIGELPPVGYYDAFDSIVKWKLCKKKHEFK